MRLTIRKATAADFSQIQRLNQALFDFEDGFGFSLAGGSMEVGFYRSQGFGDTNLYLEEKL